MKFDKAVIYRIVCKDPEITDCYVGSTTNFTKRKCQHKSCFFNEKHKEYSKNVYTVMRANQGWDNWEMVEICKASDCTSKRELHKLERKYIEELKATLNQVIPTRTQQEYNEDNKDTLTKYYNDYSKQNKERTKEYHQQYYMENKELIDDKNKKYREEHKEQDKEYQREHYEQNKEVILAKTKERYERNKEAVNARRRELYQLKKLTKAQSTQ